MLYVVRYMYYQCWFHVFTPPGLIATPTCTCCHSLHIMVVWYLAKTALFYYVCVRACVRVCVCVCACVRAYVCVCVYLLEHDLSTSIVHCLHVTWCASCWFLLAMCAELVTALSRKSVRMYLYTERDMEKEITRKWFKNVLKKVAVAFRVPQNSHCTQIIL